MTSLRRSLALLMLVVSVPFTRASAQFTEDTPIMKWGVRFLVRPAVDVSKDANGTVRIRLTRIHARIDETYGVDVDGVRYPYLAFGGRLVPAFRALEVRTISATVRYDNGQGCSGRLTSAALRVGDVDASACRSGVTPRATEYFINDLSVSGIDELRREVRRLRNQ